MARHNQLLFRFALITVFATSGFSYCFYPSGGPSDDVKCDDNAAVSMCCFEKAACLTNGMCANNPSNTSDISYTRGTCTDSTWESSICPQRCQLNQDSGINPNAYDFRKGPVQVWECGGNTGYQQPSDYCCESQGEKTRCCSTSYAVFELAAATVGNPTTRSASTTQTHSTLSTTSTPSTVSPSPSSPLAASPTAPNAPSTPPVSASSNSGSSQAVKIGVGVAVPVVALLLAALAYFVVQKRRSDEKLQGVQSQLYEATRSDPPGEMKTELQAQSTRYEMPSERVYELPNEAPFRGGY